MRSHYRLSACAIAIAVALFGSIAVGQQVDCMGSLMTLADNLNSFCCDGGAGMPGGGHRRAQDCAFTTCSSECSQL